MHAILVNFNVYGYNNQLSSYVAYLRKSQIYVYCSPPTRANVDKVLIGIFLEQTF